MIDFLMIMGFVTLGCFALTAFVFFFDYCHERMSRPAFEYYPIAIAAMAMYILY